MKTVMRLSLMIALISTVAIFSAEAQRGQGRGHGKGYGPGFGPDSCQLQLKVNQLAKELDLSEKQEANILDLHYAHMEEVKSLKGNYKNDCVGAQEARISSRAKLDEAVKKELNTKQLAMYDEFMKERRGPHAPHGPKGRHGAHRNWQ